MNYLLSSQLTGSNRHDVLLIGCGYAQSAYRDHLPTTTCSLFRQGLPPRWGQGHCMKRICPVHAPRL